MYSLLNFYMKIANINKIYISIYFKDFKYFQIIKF